MHDQEEHGHTCPRPAKRIGQSFCTRVTMYISSRTTTNNQTAKLVALLQVAGSFKLLAPGWGMESIVSSRVCRTAG